MFDRLALLVSAVLSKLKQVLDTASKRTDSFFQDTHNGRLILVVATLLSLVIGVAGLWITSDTSAPNSAEGVQSDGMPTSGDPLGAELDNTADGDQQETPQSKESRIAALFVEAQTLDQAEAKVRYEQILEIGPNNSRAHLELGLIAENLEDYDSAFAHFEAAGIERTDEAHEGISRIYTIWGEDAASGGDPEDGVVLLSKAIEYNNENDRAWGARASANYEIGAVLTRRLDFGDAAVYYRRAVEDATNAIALNQVHRGARGVRGESYLNLQTGDDLDGAIADFQHLASTASTSEESFYANARLGEAYYQAGDLTRAREHLQEALGFETERGS